MFSKYVCRRTIRNNSSFVVSEAWKNRSTSQKHELPECPRRMMPRSTCAFPITPCKDKTTRNKAKSKPSWFKIALSKDKTKLSKARAAPCLVRTKSWYPRQMTFEARSRTSKDRYKSYRTSAVVKMRRLRFVKHIPKNSTVVIRGLTYIDSSDRCWSKPDRLMNTRPP
jgi:hypothetical protein